MSDFAAFSYFLALGGFVLFIFTILGLILYFLQAYGLYKMAENRGLENSWLAFIPVANLYIMGQLTGPFNLAGMELRQPELILPILTIVSIGLSGVPVLGAIANVLVIVLGIVALYYLFLRYIPSSAILYTILSVVFPPLGAIFIFRLRNNPIV